MQPRSRYDEVRAGPAPDPAAKTVSIAILVAISALPSISISVFLPSMPGLATYFHTDIPTVQYALSLYLLGLAVGQLTYGPLSDRLGRRPVLVAGIAIYCAGSLICALAPRIEVFLFGRVLQAIGGCAGMVLGRAMVRDVHDHNRVASVIGYMLMITTVATALAPTMGGTLDELFGWQAPFLVLTGVGIVVLGACILWARETATLSTPLSRGKLWSGYISVLKHREFWRFSLYTSLVAASFYTYVAGSPIVVIQLWGYSPTEFGAWWTIGSVTYFLGNFLAGRYSEKFGTERMLLLGNPIILVGAAALLVLLAFGPRHPIAVFVPIGIVFIGSGMAQPNAISSAINVDSKNTGSASGLVGCMQILVGFLSISLLGLFPSDAPVYFGLICSGTLLLGVVISVALKPRNF